MSRAIHFLASIKDNNWPEAPGSQVWFSGFWDSKGAFEPAELPGVWIILHRPTKAERSHHGGVVIDVSPEHCPELARPDRYVIRYSFNPRARNVPWPSSGRRDSRAWCSGLVEWDPDAR